MPLPAPLDHADLPIRPDDAPLGADTDDGGAHDLADLWRDLGGGD